MLRSLNWETGRKQPDVHMFLLQLDQSHGLQLNDKTLSKTAKEKWAYGQPFPLFLFMLGYFFLMSRLNDRSAASCSMKRQGQNLKQGMDTCVTTAKVCLFETKGDKEDFLHHLQSKYNAYNISMDTFPFLYCIKSQRGVVGGGGGMGTQQLRPSHYTNQNFSSSNSIMSTAICLPT